jgi:hypothetical protein
MTLRQQRRDMTVVHSRYRWFQCLFSRHIAFHYISLTFQSHYGDIDIFLPADIITLID